ncbi:hypothetical protein OH807_29785 [Kitasatospora sp. NBC_01560]|uniref:hypothetical protein n=1 Tax=Kitasatospora sp. NBC_01560 TaxID=2975965 RepID=UPI003870D580
MRKSPWSPLRRRARPSGGPVPRPYDEQGAAGGRPADGLSAAEAAEELGWSVRRLTVFAARGHLTPGEDGRYARAEVLAQYAADPWREGAPG